MSTTLYHFCAARHVKRIKYEGLRVGGVYVPGPKGFHLYSGYSWLTTDGDPKRQSWATRQMVKYSRTAYRLTVEIPDEYADRIMDRDALERHLPGSKVLFIGWKGSECWRVYRGFIPPDWIKTIDGTEQ